MATKVLRSSRKRSRYPFLNPNYNAKANWPVAFFYFKLPNRHFLLLVYILTILTIRLIYVNIYIERVNMKHLKDKPYFTTAELADLLDISKVSIHKRIKSKKILAEMIGGSYLISKDEVGRILNIGISENDKKRIMDGVQKTIDEYGNVLKLLAKE